jgi:hypothetical protein
MNPIDPGSFDIYDDSSAIENALLMVMASDPNAPDGANLYTSLSDPELQKERPRLELVFSAGAGQRRLVPPKKDLTLRNAVGVLQDAAFKGQLKIEIVTRAEIKIHTAYRVYVRRLMATVVPALNDGVKLPLWQIDSISFGGLTPHYSPQEGVYTSIALYDFDYQLCFPANQQQ